MLCAPLGGAFFRIWQTSLARAGNHKDGMRKTDGLPGNDISATIRVWRMLIHFRPVASPSLRGPSAEQLVAGMGSRPHATTTGASSKAFGRASARMPRSAPGTVQSRSAACSRHQISVATGHHAQQCDSFRGADGFSAESYPASRPIPAYPRTCRLNSTSEPRPERERTEAAEGHDQRDGCQRISRRHQRGGAHRAGSAA